MAEILLYGEIFPDGIRDWGIESGVTDKEIVNKISEISDDEAIIVRINSPGGDADAGFAIQAALKRHPGKTIASIDGIAASSATIAMAGADVIEIAANGAIMIHEAMVGVCGLFKANELNQLSSGTLNYNARIAATYASRTDKTEEDWLDVLQNDTFYTAKEAKELGLVDEVVGNVKVQAKLPKTMLEHAPEWLQDRVKQFTDCWQPTRQEDLRTEAMELLQKTLAETRMSGHATPPKQKV